jgi:hypothetical protein
VLPQAWQIREAEIEQLGSVFLRELQDGLCICHGKAPLRSRTTPRDLIKTDHFNYARDMRLGWESGELYTCYNRSKFQVMHSVDLARYRGKLIVFMGGIGSGYSAFGTWHLALGN